MAADGRKLPVRPQTLSKSVTTGWLGIGGRLGHLNSDRELRTFKGWQPCPSQERYMSEPGCSKPSPIAQRIGMFEKLSYRHNNENVVVTKVPASSNKTKTRIYRDQLSPSPPSLLRIHSGNANLSRASSVENHGPAYPYVLDRHRLRQKAAAIRERLCSISSSNSTSSVLQKGQLPRNTRTSSQYTDSSDCVALLSQYPTEASTGEDTYERAAERNSVPGGILRKNPPSNGHIKLGSGSLYRRHLSRSDQPAVINAHCTLAQPQPVRGIEVRRLASLCKDKVSARLYRGSG